MASDNSGSGEGWRVDTVTITLCEPVPCQFTDSSSPPYAGTTPLAVRATKPSRFARVYAGTAPKPVTGNRRRDRCVQ